MMENLTIMAKEKCKTCGLKVKLKNFKTCNITGCELMAAKDKKKHEVNEQVLDFQTLTKQIRSQKIDVIAELTPLPPESPGSNFNYSEYNGWM
jgi:hypothetical protein